MKSYIVIKQDFGKNSKLKKDCMYINNKIICKSYFMTIIIKTLELLNDGDILVYRLDGQIGLVIKQDFEKNPKSYFMTKSFSNNLVL